MYLVKIATYNIQYVTIISSNRARGLIWKAYNSSSGILIFHNHYLKEKGKNNVFFLVDEKIFCCHGGLSPDLQSMEQIRWDDV